MNKFFGNYRGFVLNNTDPSKAGRVKVWVPAVHGRNYSIYNENDPQVIGGLSQAEINDHLRNTPWADVAQSLVGGGGSSAQYDGAGFTVGDGFQTGGGQIPIKSNGRVDPEQLRGYLINQIKGSQLVGVIPSDGAKFNIDGSAESWANLFTALCKNESNYKTTGTGDAGRFKSKTTGLVGSHGLFQLSADDALNHKLQSTAFTLSELQDPAINTKATIAIASRLISQHNVIAGGSSQGLSRYWGPLRRGEVNVPPVPPYRPTSPNNQSLVSVDTDILTPNTPTKKQKPAQAFSPSSNGYKVTNDTREVYGGSSVLRKQGRPISLDFNSAGGNAGIFIVVPFDVTQQERDYCMQYVNACSNFFNKYSKDPKSKNISSNPIRRGGTSENPRGIKGFFHTEAWDQDGSAMQSIIDNPQEYANILASTLGKIPNALFLPPHKVNAQGTEFKPTNSIKNVSETEFAKKYIIPFLGGANGGLVVDAFSSVGNKHPEQNRDEQFLLKLGIEQSKIDELTKIGKQLYTTTSRAKSDISGRYDSEIEELKTARDKFWDNLELDEDKLTEKNNYLSRYSNNRDYSDIPLNTKVNPASQSYGNSVYNNVSKGSFNIPEIGSKVWVFFAEGELNDPVVFANNPDAQDMAGIFDISSESPDYPVEKTGDESHINRNKYVINNTGGSFEIVGTTGNESINITSYQGNSYEMNKLGISEMVIGNKSQYIKGDEFKTIKGDGLEHYNKDRETIVLGDVNEKIGNVRKNVETSQKIKDLYRPIHDKMRLFDLQRTGFTHTLDNSPHQKHNGENMPCPICSGQNKFLTVVSKPTTFINPSGFKQERINTGGSSIDARTEDTGSCLNCGGTGVSEWSTEGKFEPEPLKKEIIGDINNTYDEMTRLENELGDGGNKTSYISKSYVVKIGSVMNDLESIRIDPKGKKVLAGITPSKSGKTVTPLYNTAPHIEKVATNDLAGGNFFMEVANKYDLLVGSNGIRAKTLGEFVLQGRTMTISAEQVIISSNNQVIFDGGQNINFKSDSITMSPRTTTKNGNDFKSIAMDGTVSVTRNMVVKGGQHVEGELSVQHMTAPLEMQQTEDNLVYGDMVAGVVIGYTSDGQAVTSTGAPRAIKSIHSHTFANLPLTLVPTNDDVRRNAHCMTFSAPVMAQQVKHGKSRLKDYACIRYFDPDLFALFEDCNDDKLEGLLDDLIEGKRPVSEIKEELTKSSESSIGVINDDCEIDRTSLDTPKSI